MPPAGGSVANPVAKLAEIVGSQQHSDEAKSDHGEGQVLAVAADDEADGERAGGAGIG